VTTLLRWGRSDYETAEDLALEARLLAEHGVTTRQTVGPPPDLSGVEVLAKAGIQTWIFERKLEFALGAVQLTPEFIRRMDDLLTPCTRCPGVGRVGKMARVGDSGPAFLVGDLTVKVRGHALEVSDHGFDLRHTTALFIDLKLLQADQCFTRLHSNATPGSRNPLWSLRCPHPNGR
jgi:hypothetical protein